MKRGDLIAYLGDPDENGGSERVRWNRISTLGFAPVNATIIPAEASGAGWLAGSASVPQDIGWLQPSLVITSQEIPIGGYPQPEVPFWIRWGQELLITSLYSICGAGILVGTIRKKSRFFLIFPGFLLIAAGIVLHNNRILSTYALLVIGILLLVVGIYLSIRRSTSRPFDKT